MTTHLDTEKASFLRTESHLNMNFCLRRNIAEFFLFINILSALIYSVIDIRETPAKLKARLIKDALFIGLTVFLGLLPVCGVY